ncbi:MAG: hypothetical protein QOG87_1487 [Actinomycetota bacterium]|jgi:hypothetical protein
MEAVLGPDDPAPPGYRRRIELRAPDGRTVVADLEDDFHRFRLTFSHDGTVITGLDGEAIRYPWATCPEAEARLRALVGTPLADRCTAVAQHDDPKQNCTHLFDLAGLCSTHALAGRKTRRYDAYVPEAVERRTRPVLWRDGEAVLDWDVEKRTVVDGTPPFAGISLTGGFVRWADDTLDPEMAEAAIVLRRAWDIARARGRDLDVMVDARPLAELLPGACFTMQPDIAARAARMTGTARDFAARPDLLLADLS